MTPRELDLADEAAAIWHAGVAGVHPSALFPRAVQNLGDALRFEGRGFVGKFKVPLRSIRRIVVVGAGKAGTAMAEALEHCLGDEILAAKHVVGHVNVPDATVKPLRKITLHPSRATHDNQATAAAAAGTKRIRKLLAPLGQPDVVIVLLSGGGSALLPAPVEGVTLEDKTRLVQALQFRGADIHDVNCIRKHLSSAKGGGLLGWTRAGLVVTLAISDVPGDSLETIASGPTVPDPTTCSDALRILGRYGIAEASAEIPAAALASLREGAEGTRSETMKLPDSRSRALVVGSLADAVNAAERHASVAGWRVLASKRAVGGDTQEMAHTLASFVSRAAAGEGPGGLASNDRAVRGVCLLSGGETTSHLGAGAGAASAIGTGGRNQELALAVLAGLGESGLRGACVLSGGTDGEDGATDAAGAWVDAKVAAKAREMGLDPAAFLARHDSHPFFRQAGGLLRTGWTGTNVMDLRVALVRQRDS